MMENESPKYPHNILEGYGLGALMDLRVRMAFNLLQTSPLMAEVAKATMMSLAGDRAAEVPMWVAKFALELTDQVLKQGAEKGWVSPLPDPSDTSISAQDRAQAARTATYQVVQQIEGAAAAQREQAGKVIPVAPRGH